MKHDSSSAGLGEIPASLSALSKLEVLQLQGNNLTGLMDNITEVLNESFMTGELQES